jgi:tetratricopeptide (TPR) repeat protein
MRLLPRLLILAALFFVGIVLFREARLEQATEGSDPSKIVMLFVGVVFLSVIAATLLAGGIIPVVGELIGQLFYTPGQEAPKDKHAAAMGKIAQGDYEGAAQEYLAAFAKDPTDTLAVSEAAHLYSDKLNQPHEAARILEEAVEGEHPVEEGAFLASRLVDVYWNDLKDAVRARQVLIQIAENLPETKHSANAHHRLSEIDRALAEGGHS